jgi:hypothetical protein
MTDLRKEFVSAAGITLFKINNPKVRNFLPKYAQRDPPDECYEETLYTT